MLDRPNENNGAPDKDPGEAGAGSGVEALALLLRFHEIPADPAQIKHQFGGAPSGAREHCCFDTTLDI